MEREWGKGKRFTLYISWFSLYFLPLYSFHISKTVSFFCKMLNTTFLLRMSQKSLTYALWENNSWSISVWESSASCEGLVVTVVIVVIVIVIIVVIVVSVVMQWVTRSPIKNRYGRVEFVKYFTAKMRWAMVTPKNQYVWSCSGYIWSKSLWAILEIHKMCWL